VSSVAPLSSRPWTAWLNALGPLFGLILVYGFFAIFGPPTFATSSTLIAMANQTVVVGIASLGMTLIIIAGGIDLSVGSMVALVTVVVAWVVQVQGTYTLFGHSYELPVMLEAYPRLWPLVAAVVGILAGGLCGLFNGSLISLFRVVPFIITLGTLLIFRGRAIEMAHEQKIDADLSWLNDLLGTLPAYLKWMVIAPGIWTLILLSLLVAGLLRYTRLGRHIFAIGSNEQTARLCGIAVNRVKIIVYTLGGLLTGVAGVMQFSRLTVGDPTVAVGLELDVIAAVVIGGASLNGGEGSIIGTVIGALIMTTIRIGCTYMQLSNPIQLQVTGAIIIVAVALDRLRHRRSS
jgi:ribose/xylose/arabinose/galactoside ABC-type transport system permease subunit